MYRIHHKQKKNNQPTKAIQSTKAEIHPGTDGIQPELLEAFIRTGLEEVYHFCIEKKNRLTDVVQIWKI